MNNLRRWLTIVAIILVGCTPNPSPSPTSTEGVSVYSTQIIQPSDSPESKPTIETQNAEVLPVRDLRIRITTTSDWTTLSLVEGAILDDYEILSSSSEASVASFDQSRFVIMQPISEAEAGQSVELVADLSITEDILGGDLVFEIDRGHIGATTVEISNFACGQPGVVETLTWEGVQPSAENTQRFKMLVAKLYEPPQNEYIVIAQLNFWYYGPGLWGGFENDLGNRSTPLTPLWVRLIGPAIHPSSINKLSGRQNMASTRSLLSGQHRAGLVVVDQWKTHWMMSF